MRGEQVSGKDVFELIVGGRTLTTIARISASASALDTVLLRYTPNVAAPVSITS